MFKALIPAAMWCQSLIAPVNQVPARVEQIGAWTLTCGQSPKSCAIAQQTKVLAGDNKIPVGISIHRPSERLKLDIVTGPLAWPHLFFMIEGPRVSARWPIEAERCDALGCHFEIPLSSTDLGRLREGVKFGLQVMTESENGWTVVFRLDGLDRALEALR